MPVRRLTGRGLLTAWLAVTVILVAGPAPAAPRIERRVDGASVVHLTQTPCVFVEAEQNPPVFASRGTEDCEAINTQTVASRSLETLRLPAGRYVFRVANRNVPYELDSWLRGQGAGRLLLPSVSGGGLMMGHSREDEIEVVKGSYSYSCPLNSTPNYTLVVD